MDSQNACSREGRPEIAGRGAPSSGLSDRTLQRRIIDGRRKPSGSCLLEVRQETGSRVPQPPGDGCHGSGIFCLGYEDSNSFYRAFPNVGGDDNPPS